MKLLTKELLKRFETVGSQEEVNDPIIIAKFFNPVGAGTWFAIEYDSTDEVFFGYVSIFGDHNDELGDFSLKELEDYTGRLGLGIERDMYFKEAPLSEIIKQYTK